MAALSWRGLWSESCNPTFTSILMCDREAKFCNPQNKEYSSAWSGITTRVIPLAIHFSHLVEDTQSNGEVCKSGLQPPNRFTFPFSWHISLRTLSNLHILS